MDYPPPTGIEEELVPQDPALKDPFSNIPPQSLYTQNLTRSIHLDILVLVGVCTHLGCIPTYRPDEGRVDHDGGFYCSCHGSHFDLAGRVFNGSSAPTNLAIPSHTYLDKNTLLIGSDDEKAYQSTTCLSTCLQLADFFKEHFKEYIVSKTIGTF